jgi:PAS domain-containing protein
MPWFEPSLWTMRDNHRPKQDLIHEVTGLRKQIVDLKEAMVARRRVEEALREAESRLRSLADGAPVGLCLFRVLGVFATTEEQSRVLREQRLGYGSGAFFRHKDGNRICLRVMAAHCPEQETVALVTYHTSTEE